MAIETNRRRTALPTARSVLLPTLAVFAAILLNVGLACRHRDVGSGNALQPGQYATEQTVGIPHYHQVSPTLYRGGQPKDEGYSKLKELGIRSIVNLRVFDSSAKSDRQEGFDVHHISFKHIHPEQEDVLVFLRIATDPDRQPVFVHCREGVDRTGMMVAIYRMVVENWPRDKAIAELRSVGFHEWNLPIEHFLRKLDIGKTKKQLGLADHTAVSASIGKDHDDSSPER